MLRTDTPIRGRERELAILTDMLAAVSAGRGGVGTIEGTAGIGKSRLLDEVERVAASTHVGVSRGAATELDRVAPLASILTALRSGQDPILSAHDLRAPMLMADARFLLAEDLLSRISRRSSSRPLLVILDDLQWADPATLYMLRSLTAGLAAQPVLWLFGTRPSPDRSEAALAVRAWIHGGGTSISLQPIDGASAVHLATDCYDGELDAALRAQVDGALGDPLLIVELVRAHVGAGGTTAQHDASFAASIERRLVTLSGETRQLLRVGAVLGRAFSVTDAAAMLGRSAVSCVPLIAEAIVAGILVDDASGLSFQHDTVRHVIHDELGPSARRGVHREAAWTLLAAGRPYGEVASHLRSRTVTGDGEAIRASVAHSGGRRPNAGWGALSDAELSVARQVAQGRTNREVARRLFISPHTVDSHLRQAFRKLRVASRVELTRIVIEMDHQPPAE